MSAVDPPQLTIAGQDLIELDGERVQAGVFREVKVPSFFFKADVFNLGTELILGDPITVYFWGPKKRPW